MKEEEFTLKITFQQLIDSVKAAEDPIPGEKYSEIVMHMIGNRGDKSIFYNKENEMFKVKYLDEQVLMTTSMDQVLESYNNIIF